MKGLKISLFFYLFFAALLALGYVRETVSFLLALVIHELGHVLVAKAQGCKITRLAIQPLGGYLYLDDLLEVQPALERRVALAGPAANLLTAVGAMALAPYSPQGFSGDFIRASLTLMAFNLLPALPLDGGRLLRGWLAGLTTYYRATKIVIASGFACGIFLTGLAFSQLAARRPNLSVFAAAGFLLYNALVERKRLLVPLLRYVLARQKGLGKSGLQPADTLVAPPGVKVNEVLKQIRPQKYYQVSVLDDTFAQAGTLTEHQLLRLILAGTGQSTLQQALEELGKRED